MNPPTKPGYLTTEFYVTIASALGGLFASIQGGLPPQWAAWLTGVVAGCYAISRAIAKMGPAVVTALSALGALRSDIARSSVPPAAR